MRAPGRVRGTCRHGASTEGENHAHTRHRVVGACARPPRHGPEPALRPGVRLSLHPLVVFFGGLVIIILGAEVLLRSAARIATMLGVSPIVIGLTIVSVGIRWR